MKKNLRSACLLFLVFLFFTIIFVGLVNAKGDEYNYSKLNKSSMVGIVKLPETGYPIWGYTKKNYTFFVNSTISPDDPSKSNAIMVFYWDCLNNLSDYNNFSLDDLSHFDNDSQKWKCAHNWSKKGNYSVAIGIFKLNGSREWEGKDVSYWIPVEIKNNTEIKVDTFYMLDENEGVGRSNTTYNISILSNSSEKSDESSNPGTSSKYCGYAKNDYSFSVVLNATFNTSNLTSEDNRTIDEITTEIYWGDGNSDNSLSIDNENSIHNNSNNTEIYANISAGSFTYEWNDIGEMEINASGFFWDPLDGARYPPNRSYNNTSILIIRDPKNFFSTSSNSISGNETVLQFFLKIVGGIFSNLQKWGILLSILGLIIFFFTYTRNNVPIEISIFERKPFYLKSVNSFTGTLIFVSGMYLYFVFGRCPWDVPIVNISYLNKLSNMYFSVLYYEYETRPLPLDIPYLSIMLGIIFVFILSLIIHLIAIPFYRGELKTGKILKRKNSSTPVQSELISSSVETKINRGN